jgi:hypothetical protein
MILVSHPSPSLLVFYLWILVYKMWPGMRVTFFVFLIRRDCLFRRGFPQHSPVIQIAVIPFEIDVPRHVNLDDCAAPLLLSVSVFSVFRVLPGFGFVKPDVVLNSLTSSSPTVAANNWICQGIMKVFRFADLLRIDDPAPGGRADEGWAAIRLLMTHLGHKYPSAASGSAKLGL